GLKGFEYVNDRMKGLLRKYPQRLRSLWGKPVMLVNPAPEFAGAGEMQRCWHGFVDENGGWLNLNRSFGAENPPPEVSALEYMILSLKPRLIIDMQEDDVPGFWVAAPHQQDNSTVVEIGQVILEAVRVEGCSICTLEQMAEQKHRDLELFGFLLPERQQNGFFWLNQDLLKEGPNLLSYAAGYGLSIGIESPLGYSLEKRVNATVNGVQDAIRFWSQLDHSM
ncbi:MAG: hypothetical protein MUO76_15080, partial [Anaerolineaceae bacterium]|nr:hypothetical protein [Anaerolineaceae bacterium]